MSDTQHDPAHEAIKQSHQETHSYEGQQGYGVEYENGKYRDEASQQMPEQGRSGSYETNNLGGYGTGQTDAQGQTHADEQPVSPTDAEAELGQGGR